MRRTRPTPGGVHSVVIKPFNGKAIRFHPFLESFKHIITPKVSKEEFGLFAVTSYYRNGITDNEYQVTIVLPAASTNDAKANYNKVKRFKKLVTPSIKKLQADTGLVKMSIKPLMKEKVGYIIAVDEDIDMDVGSLNGYPKVIKLSFTFAVDEMYAEVFGGKTPETPLDRPVAASDQTPQDKTKKTLGDRAKAAKAKKSVGDSFAEALEVQQGFRADTIRAEGVKAGLAEREIARLIASGKSVEELQRITKD